MLEGGKLDRQEIGSLDRVRRTAKADDSLWMETVVHQRGSRFSRGIENLRKNRQCKWNPPQKLDEPIFRSSSVAIV